MAEAGTESSTYRAFIAQESGNVSNDGFFNFPVLEQCLRSKGLICTPTTKSEVRPLMRDPSAQEAFICHLADHWFTLRRVRRSWWNLDSLKPAPRKVGAVYLEAFLLELQEKGYTVFLVRSATAPSPSATPDQTFLPPPDATRRERLRENQLYLDKAGRENLETLDKATSGRNLEDAAKIAKEGDEDAPKAYHAHPPRGKGDQPHSWPESGGYSLSTGEAQSSPSVGPPPDTGEAVGEDELQEAIRLSMLSFKAELTAPAAEPPEGPDVITLAVRLPDGSRMLRRFLKGDEVSTLFKWLEYETADSSSIQPPLQTREQYSLVAPFPRRTFKRMPACDVMLCEGSAPPQLVTLKTLEAVDFQSKEQLTLQL
eukprot:GHVT01072428.1.p1 GENE.GHVT01072428.1~~GHVT01072428.1.p1  ORF type:complete len:370 (+),score=68.12 GHVT01072428.1:197-1306(+)